MQELIYNNKNVRIKMFKKEPWFVAKDICELFGLKWQKEKSIKGLVEFEKKLGVLKVPSGDGTVQKREMWLVNESGLYTLIMRSRKPEAIKFRIWVTNEVLPMIRKYGFYSLDSKKIKRADKRIYENKRVEMLSKSREHLGEGDYSNLKRKLGVNECHTKSVMWGNEKDITVQGMMVAKALKNKELEEEFFSMEGMQGIINILEK